ncbi:uncharacterized protein LOC112576237 [Pomacea canaliculata]|uniref:uncharacterized protein LOC112576237 n=1 Tax=Pomacea canaliculata TaxID=400727 RepID=UPI000D7273FA|nr:uncharacterized protein LOC112576237 [Pomacea canaliculata]
MAPTLSWLLVGSALVVAVCVGSTRRQRAATTPDPINLSRLLLSRTRFRDLPEDAVPTDADDGTVVEEAAGFGRDLRSDVDDPFEKRHRQRMLVSNLAALLSGLKDRNEASMRMPSLRFGK